MTTRNQCQFWDCDKTIPYDHFLCYDHWTELLEVEIDPCQACGLFKDVDYDVCGNCYRQTASAWSNQGYGAEPRGNRQSLDEALFEKLRTLRNRLAKANGVQEYMVFSNDTLVEMATVHPTTPEALLAIYGVGPAKMERYGPDFLHAIREHAGTNTGRKNPQTPRPSNDAKPQLNQQPVANSQIADPRNRYPAYYRTSDGHYVRSRAEAMIDDWLFNRHIAHAYERKLPVEDDVLCDFYLPQGNVYIEFWGRGDDPAYARRMQEKQQIYQRHNLQLISLTDAELYRLDDHMPGLLRPHGVNVT